MTTMPTVPPPPEDDVCAVEVTIFEDGVATLTAQFATILEGEAFANEWLERMPGSQYEIEDRNHDHTAWQATEAQTALDLEYPTTIC